MRGFNKFLLLSLIGLTVAGATAIAAFHSRGKGTAQTGQPQKSREMTDFENKFPIADADEPEPTDLKERENRQARGRKYDKDKSGLAIDPYSDVVTTSSHWATGLPAIPVEQSAAIVVGSISNARAHLSSNKKKVYSEFTVKVEEVLKNDKDDSIQRGCLIDVDRVGGRVRFQNGKIGLYWVTGQGMPSVGGRYLLFLSQTDEDPSFSMLIGYELRDGSVFLLDNPGGGHPITRYQGADEAALLRDVRTTVNKNP